MKKIFMVLLALYATAFTPLATACEGSHTEKKTAHEHQHEEAHTKPETKS